MVFLHKLEVSTLEGDYSFHVTSLRTLQNTAGGHLLLMSGIITVLLSIIYYWGIQADGQRKKSLVLQQLVHQTNHETKFSSHLKRTSDNFKWVIESQTC